MLVMITLGKHCCARSLLLKWTHKELKKKRESRILKYLKMEHGFGVIVLNVPQPCRELLQQRKKPLGALRLDRIPTHSHRDAVWRLECHVWAPLLFVLLAGVLSVDLGFLFWHAQVWVSRHGPAFHPQLGPPPRPRARLAFRPLAPRFIVFPFLLLYAPTVLFIWKGTFHVCFQSWVWMTRCNITNV